MDSELTTRFIQFIERQLMGDNDAIDELHALEITQSQGQCLFDLYGEWRGAFSYSPGRCEVLSPLLSLAKWLQETRRDPIDQKNRRPEWAQLVALRGPVDAVLYRSCTGCKYLVASMGTSGFYDALGLICSECGNVYFKSFFDESETPLCSCGAMFVKTWPCSKCGDERYEEVCTMSPYEYFAQHSYSRGEGA